MEFEDQIISVLESEPEPFAFSGMDKGRLNGGLDSARIIIHDRLGSMPDPDQTHTNTLFVVFNQYYDNGFNNIAPGWHLIAPFTTGTGKA